jgi:hypothetical protein
MFIGNKNRRYGSLLHRQINYAIQNADYIIDQIIYQTTEVG